MKRITILLRNVVVIGCLLSAGQTAALAQQDNGIAVGKPKVFDNRTLTLMLESLNQSLSSVQVIDQKQLMQSLGLLQGYQSQEVSRSLDISTLPLPDIKTTLQPDSSGKLVPSQQTTERSSFSPSAPKLPDTLTPPKFEPQFGSNAYDLLNDQVNLTYQIFNIRMLLERSLSDRLWQATESLHARQQAVLGFQISLNPPKEGKDLAAEIEVTLSPENGTGPLDLVALMPLEKTYNSAALSSESNAFGGSAVVKFITIGYSQRSREQTLYIYHDTDTIALQRMSKSNNPAITFGWQFRPVLGRRSVSPGVRQMFAVVALPQQDTPANKDPFRVKVSVRTYWRYYDRETLTTSDRGGFWSWFSSLPKPDSNDYVIPINTTVVNQESLRAEIEKVEWVSTDDKSAVVLVSGQNFFRGTTVVLGSTTLTESNGGLILKSDQALQINAPLSAIAAGGAVINGRYGPSTLLRVPKETLLRVPKERIPFPGPVLICDLQLNPMGEQFYTLSVYLAKRCEVEVPNKPSIPQVPLLKEDLPDRNPPILLINGTFYAQPYQLLIDKIQNTLVLKTIIPVSLHAKDAVVTVKFPFMDDGWSPSVVMYDPCPPLNISRIGGGKTTMLVILGVQNCGTNWRVLLDRSKPYDVDNVNGPLRHPARDVLTFEPDSNVLKQYKKLVVYALGDKSQVLQTAVLDIPTIPSAKTPPFDPKLDTTPAPPQLIQFEGRGVTYKGSGLKAITKIEFNGQNLSFTSKDGKSITVFLTPTVTRKPGLNDILLKTADGTIIPAPLLITPAPGEPAAKK